MAKWPKLICLDLINLCKDYKSNIYKSYKLYKSYKSYKCKMGVYKEIPYIDPVIIPELDKIKKRVLFKDMDYVGVFDGDEGTGKSVLAMQICKYLDPNFNIDQIVFTSDQFLALIKSEKIKKGSAVLLDEAYNAANSRAAMSEVNRAMVAVATEMRQRNLFVFFVLPSFFDLDRALAVHRTRSLFHVYFTNDYDRGQYVVFPKDLKRELYLTGKKKYSYAWPRSPYPPLRFNDEYIVDEQAYRRKKAEAFRKRSVSVMAKKWINQRNAYVKFIYQFMNISQDEISKIPCKFGYDSVGQDTISEILKQVELITPLTE